MTIKEIYDLLGADYDGVVARMCGEARVIKFVPKFLADPTYNELIEGFETENWELAFRAAHTMKGVCSKLNLSLPACVYGGQAGKSRVPPGIKSALSRRAYQQRIKEIMKNQPTEADYKAVADALTQLDA